MRDDSTPQPPDPLADRPQFLDDLPGGAPELLPHVEPPSAGFIVQLFVVPAVIVAAIVGVYLLFGQLASGEQDWRKQLTGIRSENPHVRWRGALGLAQMLQADASADGERLAENRDVAEELAKLLNESIRKASTSEDDLKQQEFLTRTLGLVDVDDVTLPALKLAVQPEEDSNVRKNALAAMASIASRRNAAGKMFDDSLVVDDVVSATGEQESVLRHVATFALGLFGSTEANQRLEVLVEHPDLMTRLNAALGLARHKSLRGLQVFESVLDDAQSVQDLPVQAPTADPSDESAAVFEQALMLSNTLKALDDLSDQLSAQQKQQVVSKLTPLAESYPQPQLRVESQQLLQQLTR